MLATGSLGTLYTDRRAGEGNLPRLIECSLPANAPDKAVAELADGLPILTRRDSIGFPMRADHERPPTRRNLGRKPTELRFLPFPISHVVPRWLSSFFVAENEVATERFSEQRKSFRDSENLSGSQKADVNG